MEDNLYKSLKEPEWHAKDMFWYLDHNIWNVWMEGSASWKRYPCVAWFSSDNPKHRDLRYWCSSENEIVIQFHHETRDEYVELTPSTTSECAMLIILECAMLTGRAFHLPDVPRPRRR